MVWGRVFCVSLSLKSSFLIKKSTDLSRSKARAFLYPFQIQGLGALVRSMLPEVSRGTVSPSAFSHELPAVVSDLTDLFPWHSLVHRVPKFDERRYRECMGGIF